MTRLRTLSFAVVGLTVAVAVLALVVYLDTDRLSSLSDSTTTALCAFRQDLSKRVSSGTTFLISHPHGIPGIPIGTIRVSLTNEQATLKSLSALKC
jgi:uncharacterized membrane protein (Fun14 family)